MENQQPSTRHRPSPSADFHMLERRITELEELLGLSRKLSNILNLNELYTLLSEVVLRKIGAGMLSIFIYRKNTKTFRLVYTYGVGETNRDFMFENINPLWNGLLSNKPFPLHNDSGVPHHPELYRRFHFDQMHADWLIPMMMQN